MQRNTNINISHQIILMKYSLVKHQLKIFYVLPQNHWIYYWSEEVFLYSEKENYITQLLFLI